MIDRARELLRLAADGTHVSGTEWVPVVEGLLAEIERLEDNVDAYIYDHDMRDAYS